MAAVFQSDRFSETQQALMMSTVTLCLCCSNGIKLKKKNLIVLVKANDGHDGAELVQLTVSVLFFFFSF